MRRLDAERVVASDPGPVVPLAFAPDGSRSYGTYNNGGEIRRIFAPS